MRDLLTLKNLTISDCDFMSYQEAFINTHALFLIKGLIGHSSLVYVLLILATHLFTNESSTDGSYEQRTVTARMPFLFQCVFLSSVR